jgi:hypothetical protein
MSNKSRRRVTTAAGAILAGAAIPLVAAGIAWADDLPLPPTVQGIEQLGVPPLEAIAADLAEASGQPVAISVDGINYTDGIAGATALSGNSSDVAVAIGQNAYADAGVNDSALYQYDNAYADGTNAFADAGGSSSYFGTPGGSHDTAIDIGNNSANGDGAGAWGSGDHVSVIGANDSIAAIGNADTLTAAGSGDFLPVFGSSDAITVTSSDLTLAPLNGMDVIEFLTPFGSFVP